MLNPTGLCQCGCGDPAPLSTYNWRAHGYVKGEPRRFIHGHNNRADHLITPDRYAVTPGGCWQWLGHVDPSTGYGKAGGIGAHRRSFLEHGGVIPPGYQIDHLCRNRACVNPAHLEVVTSRENTRRGNLGKKLDAERARAILNDQRSHTAIARDYDVTISIVGRIKSGKAWARATGLDETTAGTEARC